MMSCDNSLAAVAGPNGGCVLALQLVVPRSLRLSGADAVRLRGCLYLIYSDSRLSQQLPQRFGFNSPATLNLEILF